jgi:outer membrane protein assembly factor BamB
LLRNTNKKLSRRHRLLGCFTLTLVLLVVLGINLFRGIRFFFWLTRPIASFPLVLKWETDLGNSTYDFPAYHDGIVVLPTKTTFSSYWYGVDATTGRVAWSRMAWWQRLGFHNYRRCLTDEYLVVSGPWSLLTLKTHTGEVVWKAESADTADCSEKTVFFSGAPKDPVHAFDIATGQIHWGNTSPSKSFNSLVYNPETEEVIAQQNVGPEDYYIIDAQSGQLLRSFEKVAFAPADSRSGRGSMHLIDRGQLFIGGTVLDARTGQVIHKENRYNGSTPPAVTEDTVYISNSIAGIVAIDRQTFEVKWRYQPEHKLSWLPLSSQSSVAILDGIGYVIFADATLRAFDPDTGQELGYWQPGWFDLWRGPHCVLPPMPGCSLSVRAGLTVSEDTLFVSFGDGKLYAFGE